MIEKQRSLENEGGGMGDLDDEIFCDNDNELDMDMMMDDADNQGLIMEDDLEGDTTNMHIM